MHKNIREQKVTNIERALNWSKTRAWKQKKPIQLFFLQLFLGELVVNQVKLSENKSIKLNALHSSSDLNNAENTRLLELLKKQPLPIKTRRTAEYTIVLDLDETLVHASLQPPTDGIHDFEFEVVIADGTTYTVYVKLRPGLNEFLERMSATYELVLFTASKQIYAEKLTSMLDPEKKCIKHRLYRE